MHLELVLSINLALLLMPSQKSLIESLILSIMPRHRMIESCGVPLAISPILRHKLSKG